MEREKFNDIDEKPHFHACKFIKAEKSIDYARRIKL